MKIRLSELKKIIREEVGAVSLVGRLNAADWDYEMSDDALAYQRGQDEVQKLSRELRAMDTASVDALLADPQLRPYPRNKIEFILGRK